MMNPAEIAPIASAAITILVPYLQSLGTDFAKEAIESIGSKAGETAWGKAEKLYGFIKGKFSSNSNIDEVIKELEKTPNDEDTQATLRRSLKKEMESDKTFADELRTLVEEISSAKTDVVFNSTFLEKVGTVVQTGNVHGGIHIHEPEKKSQSQN